MEMSPASASFRPRSPLGAPRSPLAPATESFALSSRCSARPSPGACSRRTRPPGSGTRSRSARRSCPSPPGGSSRRSRRSSAPASAPSPIFAAGTGLRPEEWTALERRDVDREARVVTVERVYSQRVLKQCGKSSRRRRRVPLRERVLDALEALPPALGYPSALPCDAGGYIQLNSGGCGSGRPPSALRASSTAGSMTCATPTRPGASQPESPCSRSRVGWVPRWAMIDATYGRLDADAERVELGLLVAYDATFGQLSDTAVDEE